MIAALVALVVAVGAAIVYGIGAERLDYASVRRRQLDVVAALVACVCLAGIVYGGATARARSVEPPPAPAVATTDAPSPPGAVGSPAVRVRVENSPTEPPVPVGLLAAALTQADGQDVTADEGSGVAGHDLDLTSGAERSARTLDEPVPLATLLAASVATDTPAWPAEVPTALAPATPNIMPTPTAVVLIVTREATSSRPATATRPAPTSPPPTQALPPLPSATPHCGQPYTGYVHLSDLAAEANRDGQDLVVRFRARIRNDASFPITMSDVAATALNQVAGAEQYGSMRLADIAIEPGAVVTVEGAVVLTKLPPPFGRTELCLSFAIESCGTRGERLIRQCATVRGF